KKLIERKNKNITSGLDYARQVQQALLPDESKLNSFFPNSFLWYQPKDIVSGDFCMFREVGDNVFIIAADCTGHGVSGAFLTILGRMILRELIQSQKLTDPAVILERLDNRIVDIFHKDGVSDIRDGMDISIIVHNKKINTYHFSAAKSSVLYLKNGELFRVKGSRYEIGDISHQGKENKFETVNLPLSKGDSLYLFSDGFRDQFSSNNKTKIGPRRVYELIMKNYKLPMQDQKEIISSFLNNWKGDKHQTDDLLFVGLTIE
ncbi:MAG: PP2C family protein-serine/threonine phosphatase, partial [Cyclobacteriaceae bacterium]